MVFGIDTAKYMAPVIKDTVQLTIVAYLLYIGEWPYALGLLATTLYTETRKTTSPATARVHVP